MNPHSKTILVLEDEKVLMEAIKSKLESGGFSVVTAREVDQAINYLKKGTKVDAVWLDHYLFGRQSGLDFVTKLRQNKSWKTLPVFVVSNTVSPDKVKAYLSLGVQKCYTKVDHKLDQIEGDIKKFLERQRYETS